MKTYFSELLHKSIEIWIAEDVRDGDHTTLSTIPKDAKGKAKLLIKDTGVYAGFFVANEVFKYFDPEIKVESFLHDGSEVKFGDIPFTISGSVRSILQTERLVLNILQRLSGVATQTREYADLIKDFDTKILDTRKTTPGLRYLEKEAVRLGGGVNHRVGLFDMILIKDNHIDFSGGIQQAIKNAQKYLHQHKKDLKIEVEARSLKDVNIILQTGGVDRILLDNFTPDQTRKAVKLINGKVETESSGGITKDTIRDYAACGVDYISVGALTHQIKSLDMSLKADF